MRTLLSQQDVQTFLGGGNWPAALDKTIKNWKTASSKDGKTFLSMIFLNSINKASSSDQIRKEMREISKGGYQFSAKDFLTAFSSFSEESIDAYKVLVDHGKSLDFDFSAIASEIVRMFEKCESKDWVDYLKLMGIDCEEQNVKHLIYLTCISTSDFFDTIDADDTESTFADMLVHEIKEQNPILAKTFEVELDQDRADESMKTDWILEYLQKMDLRDPVKAKEWLDMVIPPQNRLEKYMEQNDLAIGILDYFSFIEKANPKPVDWFSPEQIRIIRAIEVKSGVLYLEKEAPTQTSKSRKM